MPLPKVVNLLGERSLASRGGTEIPLNEPVAPPLDKVTEYLHGVHQRAWFTNFGELHECFEQRLCDYLGVENLLLVNNGTTALQVAAKVLGGRTALTTPYSFAATSSALDWMNMEIHYSDIDSQTWNLCPQNVAHHLATHPEVDLIVPAHIYGSPCNIDELEKVAARYGVKTLYDAAQCFGVSYSKSSVLAYGDASAISFHATKLFHCIEGGAICFRHKKDYERAKQMINFGFDGAQLGAHGLNGKLNEYQAAAGLALLDDIEMILAHRKSLFYRYQANLKANCRLQTWDSAATANGGYFPVKLASAQDCQRLKIALHQQSIQSRIYFQAPLHKHYGNGAQCPVADDLIERVLTLPLHANLTEGQVDRICDIVLSNV